jgi:hypothetical protein
VWYFAGAVATAKRLLSKAGDSEREQIRRFNEAYARRREKSPEGKRSAQDRMRDRRLLGVRELGLSERRRREGQRNEQR